MPLPIPISRKRTAMKAAALVGCFPAFLAICSPLAWCQGDFTGFKLFQSKPMTEKHRELLKQMDEFLPEDVVDFWSNPSQETVEFLVKSETVEDVKRLLEKEDLPYRIKVDDFQMIVDEQMRHIRDAEGEFQFRAPGKRPDPREDFNLFNYHRLDDIESYMLQVQSAFPDLVEVKEIGETYEGRKIRMVSLSANPSGKSGKPAIFMDCGIHAREWISPAFCLYALDRLVENESAGLLDIFDFYVVPVANPDGYEYTWNGNRMWRKNRKPSAQLFLKSAQFWPQQGSPGLISGLPGFQGTSSSSKCWGADPNRNFDVAHGTVGSSDNPCQDTYHGDRPFSEAESQALKSTLEGIVASHGGPDKVTYVSVHAFSQLWMFPNGHVKSTSRHHSDLKRVSEKAITALRDAHGTQFKAGPIATIIYEAAGSSVDWAHTKLGIKYSFALELRDQGQYGFMLPVDQIKPAVEETWAGIQGMAFEIAKEL